MSVTNRVGWSWKSRDGAEQSVTLDVADLSEASVKEARRVAIRFGYPGHAGGWWNYLVADLTALIRGKGTGNG